MKTQYNGMTNIWLNIKDLSRFPNNNEDYLAIDHLKCNKGYCLISRSVTHKNVNVSKCLSLDLDKISSKNIHLFKIGHIILCKMNSWNNYIPGQIKNIEKDYVNDDYILCGNTENIVMNTIENTFDICFPSCPDSQIALAWHYSNEILANKTILTYKNPLLNGKNKYNCKKHLKYKNNAPFLYDDSEEDKSKHFSRGRHP